jgi:hypothetical protein
MHITHILCARCKTLIFCIKWTGIINIALQRLIDGNKERGLMVRDQSLF